MKSRFYQKNSLAICSHLLKRLKIRYTKFHLKNLLNNHLDSFSILAIKDTLLEYGIESGVFRKGEYSYLDFSLPFICSIQREDWQSPLFTIVSDVNEKEVKYLNPISQKITTLTLDEFQTLDKGLIMLIDDSQQINEKNFKDNLAKERNRALLNKLPLALMAITLFLCSLYIVHNFNSNYSWGNLGFLFTTFIGFSISVLLILHEIDKDNPFVRQVCGKGSSKINCNAVLSSSHSSLFGISWTIWGASYFSMLLLIQLIFANSFSFLLITTGLSLFATPYVIYSLYIQWRIIKQWCILCLGIQFILIINTLISYFVIEKYSTNYRSFSSDFYPIISTLLIGVISFIVINEFIPLFKLARNSLTYEKKLRLIKSKKEIFDYFLNNSTKITSPSDTLGVVIGNHEAKNEIIKVCNPYCPPCSDIHSKLERIIKNNKDVKLRIIFTASGDKNDKKREPVIHFLAIQQKFGKELVHTALDDWYSTSEKGCVCS